jgi:hypothetical protein
MLQRRIDRIEQRCHRVRKPGIDWSLVTDAELDRLEGLAEQAAGFATKTAFPASLAADGPDLAARHHPAAGQGAGRIRQEQVGPAVVFMSGAAGASRTAGRFVVIVPESWSAEALHAYDPTSQAGDVAWKEGLIGQETGEVVDLADSSVIKLLEIREHVGGPL